MVALFIRSETLRLTLDHSVDTMTPLDTVFLENGHASTVLVDRLAEAILIGFNPIL